MTKLSKAAIAAPPILEHGVTEPAIARNLRVVDAGTGEEIAGIISADAGAGHVRRYQVADGNLVRDGDSYAIVDEARDIRIEWIEAPADTSGGEAEDAG